MTDEQKREELIDMVNQFRIPELQTFLVHFGDQHIRHRKNVLQKKAIKLLWTKQRKKFTLYANKVRSIFEEMKRPLINNEPYNYPSSSIAKYINLSYHNGEERVHSRIPLKKPKNSVDEFSNSYWSRCKNLDIGRISRITFVEPSFFKPVSDIVPIKPLIPSRERDDYFEHSSTFSVPDDIWSDFNFTHQVLLRMCILNEDMLVHDSLPPKLFIWLNNQLCLLPQSSPIISNISKPEPKNTADAPVDLTPYLCKYAVVNHLVIRWSSQYYRIYGICIQAMKRKPSDQLIEGLTAKGEQSPEISKKIINQNLNDDDDSEIAATSLKVSLICPLGKMLMSLPTRATTCNHLQCFDGRFFIKLNEVKSTWLCPVCNQSCIYENLIVDGYFMDILRSDRFEPGVKEVNLNADGSWESVKDNSSRKRSASPSPVANEKKSKIETIDDEIEFVASKESVQKERHRSAFPEPTSLLSNDWGELFKETQAMNDPYQYDIDRISTPSPLSSSNCSWISSDSTDVTENTPTAAPIANDSRGNIARKKDVLLVDLTESNSESEHGGNDEDDIRSVSSNSSSLISSFFSHLREKLNNSPPIYDIDSD